MDHERKILWYIFPLIQTSWVYSSIPISQPWASRKWRSASECAEVSPLYVAGPSSFFLTLHSEGTAFWCFLGSVPTPLTIHLQHIHFDTSWTVLAWCTNENTIYNIYQYEIITCILLLFTYYMDKIHHIYVYIYMIVYIYIYKYV